MRIILVGPEKFENTIWESLVDKYKDIKERARDL